MFVTLTRKKNGEDLSVILNTEEISVPSIGELHQEPTRLYDEDGNVVEERQPTEKLFKAVVIFKANNHHTDYIIGETECDKLVNALTPSK